MTAPGGVRDATAKKPVKKMDIKEKEWFEDYVEEDEDLQIDEYDLTASPSDFKCFHSI